MAKKLKKKKIVVTLVPNRDGTEYERVQTRTDVSKFLMECAFGEMIFTDGTVNMSKVRHTRKYIFKRNATLFIRRTVRIIREVFYRTAHVFRAIKEACGKDFEPNKYVGERRVW